MSYEGYDEYLCAAGHRRVFDAYDSPELNSLSDLCSCGQSFVFRHCVDETNCEGTPYPFEVDEPADTAECNLGHVHVTREVRYRIPQR